MRIITPWGRPDSEEKIAEGITFYSTPGHGGFYVSKARRDTMPDALVNDDGWYEEDCEWCKVVLAFPEYFPGQSEDAAKTYKRWFTEQA